MSKVIQKHLLAKLALASLCLAAGFMIGGCYVGPASAELGFEVDGPPPPLQDEVVITQPGPEFLWIGGFWDWDAGARHYVWKAGRWERPPRAGATWIAPHYEMRANRHYYQHGHWSNEERDRHDRRDRG